MFCKNVFLEILQNSQENTCARVSFLIKLQAQPATLLKKRLWRKCFPLNFAKFLRTPFVIEHLCGLLLDNGNLIKTNTWNLLFLKDLASKPWAALMTSSIHVWKALWLTKPKYYELINLIGMLTAVTLISFNIFTHANGDIIKVSSI